MGVCERPLRRARQIRLSCRLQKEAFFHGDALKKKEMHLPTHSLVLRSAAPAEPSENAAVCVYVFVRARSGWGDDTSDLDGHDDEDKVVFDRRMMNGSLTVPSLTRMVLSPVVSTLFSIALRMDIHLNNRLHKNVVVCLFCPTF